MDQSRLTNWLGSKQDTRWRTSSLHAEPKSKDEEATHKNDTGNSPPNSKVLVQWIDFLRHVGDYSSEKTFDLSTARPESIKSIGYENHIRSRRGTSQSAVKALGKQTSQFPEDHMQCKPGG